MSRLAIGTVQFGQDYGITNNDGQVQINEVREILKFAKINNINTLDTASNYGNSEDILGEVGVDGHHVITKTTSLKYGVNGVIKEFHNSLKKIKQSIVKGLLIHNIDEIEDKKFDGIYNAVAPERVNNIEFTKSLLLALNRFSYPVFIKAPSIIVKLIFGEQSDLVLNGLNISSEKLVQSNYKLKFTELSSALSEIYTHKN